MNYINGGTVANIGQAYSGKFYIDLRGGEPFYDSSFTTYDEAYAALMQRGPFIENHQYTIRGRTAAIGNEFVTYQGEPSHRFLLQYSSDEKKMIEAFKEFAQEHIKEVGDYVNLYRDYEAMPIVQAACWQIGGVIYRTISYWTDASYDAFEDL